MPAARKLTAAAVKDFLTQHPKWKVVKGKLVRTFEFKAFLDGIRFVQQVASLAEAADHHPDIDVRYRFVTLRFVTHDVDGLTENDTRLAADCDIISGALKPVASATVKRNGP